MFKGPFGLESTLVSQQYIQPLVHEVVEMMQSSPNRTLLLESDESTRVVESLQSSTYPTLLLCSDVSIEHVFDISNS
jgi:hypothetical protein